MLKRTNTTFKNIFGVLERIIHELEAADNEQKFKIFTYEIKIDHSFKNNNWKNRRTYVKLYKSQEKNSVRTDEDKLANADLKKKKALLGDWFRNRIK